MPRKDGPAPNGPETFDRLKARLGRYPTADELSRELLTAHLASGHSTNNESRRRPARLFTVVALIGVVGLALLARVIFVGQQPAPAPDLPPAPASEIAAAPPLPAVVMPPPPPPAEEVPIRTPARRRAPATPPARAPKPPASPRVEDAAIQRRVLPDIPASARRTITGRVRINVRVSVDPLGNVPEAVSASPDASRYFTGLAVKAAQGWKFASAPADRGDSPREWVIRFELGRQATTAAAVAAVP